MAVVLLISSTVWFGCPSPPEQAGAVSDDIVGHNILGTAYLGQQKWGEAEAAFRAALKLRPTDPLLLNNAAVAVNQQGRVDEADALLRQALESDPSHPYAHYNLGLVEKKRGQFESARDHFLSVESLDPDDLLTQYNLGIVLSRTGESDAAENAFRNALQSNPTHVSSLYGLGRLLMTLGKEEEGAELIRRSQEIRERSGLDEAVGSQYGEEGPYAMGVDYDGGMLAAPSAIDVRFETLEFVVEGALAWQRGRSGSDGGDILFVTTKASAVTLDSQGIGAPIDVKGDVRRLLPGDVNNDGVEDLIALIAEGPRLTLSVIVGGEDGPKRLPTAIPSLPDTGLDALLVDRDHDGDLDLFACWNGAKPDCLVATNDASGDFEIRSGLDHGIVFSGSDAGEVQVAFSDLDNDRDVDLLAGSVSGIQLFSNQRDDSFEDVSDRVGLGASVPNSGWHLADLNKDGWMDLVRTHDDGLSWHLNRRGILATPTAVAGCEGGSSLVVLDHDNDGFLDVACGGRDHALRLVRNLGAGQWEIPAGLFSADSVGAPRTSLDLDGDGDLDLVVQDADGKLTPWRNDGGNDNRWIRITSQGIGDNKFGIGAKVEVLAGSLRQKFEIVDGAALHVGLGGREAIESARYVWPGGVLQDEIQLTSNQLVEIEQLDRKGTSCPLLYAWRDDGWKFVTDFLGGAAVGYQLAPGVFNTPDPDEYIKIVGGLTEVDGSYRVRLNNQLEEVIWFDQAELVVVDHPVGTEVFPDEKLLPGPPYAGFRLFASSDIRPLVSAIDPTTGKDWTATIADLDRDYVDNFERLPFKGYAEIHTLELDLGPFSNDDRVVLLLDGWIDYADSSANVAAHQAGASLLTPQLQIADGRGGFRTVDREIGFPAGLPKTLTVDLEGLFDGEDHRIRLVTSMRLYWDRVQVLVGGEDTPLQIQRLAADEAVLRHGGFPAASGHGPLAPPVYLPEQVAPQGGWKTHLGHYTGLGPVEPLLAKTDNAFVTSRNGDEIALRYPAPPPPPQGWTRTFLLYASGFGKDMDPNSAANTSLGPIPFHGMTAYPYGDEVRRAAKTMEWDRPPRVVFSDSRGMPGVLSQGFAGQ
ncbi:MAG: tetratricopeptide repeat protein [Acidobacteriota bacterium]|nr:tetratricopeptide repeat protein [Acidobacteriota bacterium]